MSAGDEQREEGILRLLGLGRREQGCECVGLLCGCELSGTGKEG